MIQHYRCKRFFCKFYFRNSPVCGAIAGAGSLILGAELFLLWLMFFAGKLLFLNSVSAIFPTVLLLGFFLYILQLFYYAIRDFAQKTKRKPLQITALFPVSAAVFLFGGLFTYSLLLDEEIRQQKAVLAGLLGYPVEVSGLWAEENSGFPITGEPLKTLLSAKLEAVPENPDWLLLRTEQLELWKNYEEKNAEFLNALSAWTAMGAPDIRHEPADTIWQILLPELLRFRLGARMLAVKMAAYADDPEIVRECNRDLTLLRDSLLKRKNIFLISALVAQGIEAIRLDALAQTLKTGSFRPELPGAPPPWAKIYASAVSTEAIGAEELYNNLQSDPQSAQKAVKALGFDLPPAVYPLAFYFRIIFQRDRLCALQEYITFCRIFQDSTLTALQKSERNEWSGEKIKAAAANCCFLTGMMMPSLDRLFIKQGEIEGKRLLLETAGAIKEYKMRNDRLPESLAFLPAVPSDPVTGNAIGYETGKLKFGETFRDGFRLFLPYDKNNQPCRSGADAKITLFVTGNFTNE